jgi:hypothetical protein
VPAEQLHLEIVPPQPSGRFVPQMSWHVIGVQPHWFGVPPPPHVSWPVQGLPQSIIVVPSQLATVPQTPAVHGLAQQWRLGLVLQP